MSDMQSLQSAVHDLVRLHGLSAVERALDALRNPAPCLLEPLLGKPRPRTTLPHFEPVVSPSAPRADMEAAGWATEIAVRLLTVETRKQTALLERLLAVVESLSEALRPDSCICVDTMEIEP